MKLNIWRVLAIVGIVVIVLVAVRLATSKPGASLIDAPAGGLVVNMQKFTCKGPKGNLHGRCADSWWEHFWHDLDYCVTLKAACEIAGGTWESEPM